MAANWFSGTRKNSAQPTRRTRRQTPRPALEALEDRLVLNNRFVIPGTPDGVTNFASLKAALVAPGLNAGDKIQIEPGSTPGGIVNANIPNVFDLTVQGDPTTPLQLMPGFSLDDAVTMGPPRAGFTFKHVQFAIVGGTLQYTADDTIADCQIFNASAGDGIQIIGTSEFVLSGSTLSNAPLSSPGHNLVMVQPGDGGSNQITDNHFVAPPLANITLLSYQGGSRSREHVAHNSFSGFTGPSPLMQASNTQGLVIESNTFLENSSNANALTIVEDAAVAILDNDISIPTASDTSTGISFQSDSQVDIVTGRISNNRIDTAGLGFGIAVSSKGVHVGLEINIQGNDLQNNTIGVSIDTLAGQSTHGLDLGGGAVGSLGGNDFRDDRFAIVTTSPQNEGPITAKKNIFGVADPTTVISDNHNDPLLAQVQTDGSLTGNAAFVETLYLDFLHRTGDINNSNDAGRWVVLMSQGMPAAAVANQLVRSAEALSYQVNAAFHQFLGRDVDTAANTYFVGYLQSSGTLEGVDQTLLASAEYQARFPTDISFVQSLYQTMLHRAGSSAEITGAAAQLATIGHAGMAQEFLFSQEYRGLQVADDYTRLLKRDQPPSTAEVAFWTGGGLDLLSLDTLFAATQEFQQDA